MKSKGLFVLVVFMLSLSIQSFKQDDGKYTGSFSAHINGEPFAVREDQMYRGLLVNKKMLDANGTPIERTVIQTTVQGSSYHTDADRLFTENIRFEIGYDEKQTTGEPAYYAVAVQFHSGNYYMLKKSSKLTITKLEWETDQKHFKFSATYTCTMRSFATNGEEKPDITLTGNMEDIRITVPSWLTTKN